MKGIKDYYNKTAQAWADRWYGDDELLPYLKIFLTYLPERPRVLDLCCGAGYESMRLSKLGAVVTGLDFSEESIRIARERNPHLTFVVYDMLEDYSFLGAFDGVACLAGLVHIPDEKLAAALGNIHKVLKTGGVLFAAVRDGTGKDDASSCFVVDGATYDRAFYLHTREELARAAAGLFDFVREIIMDGQPQWRFYVFRKRAAEE